MAIICKKILSHQGRISTTSASSTPVGTKTFTRPKLFAISTGSSNKQATNTVPSLVSSASSFNSDMVESFYPSTPVADPITDTEQIEDQHQHLVGAPKVPFGWEVRYDPTLGEYYYLNQINNLIQLDHPEEVLSPISRHNSADSIFLSRYADKTEEENDSNYKLSKYGEHGVTSDYTERALNQHYLLANGTGIAMNNNNNKKQTSWKTRFSSLKRISSKNSKSAPTLREPQQQPVLQLDTSIDDDNVSAVSTLSDSSSIDIDMSSGHRFYGRSSALPQQDEDSDNEEEEEENQEAVRIMRQRMLMEVQSCEMTKLATI